MQLPLIESSFPPLPIPHPPHSPSNLEKGQIPFREAAFSSCLWCGPLCCPEADSFIPSQILGVHFGLFIFF